MRRMVHAKGGRGCTWLPPHLPIPILRRAQRLAIQYQHYGRNQYDRSHWRLHPAIYFDNCRAHHISTIALPEFIFWYYVVSVPEVAWATIQGSRTRWRSETCECENGTGTDATRDGGEARAQGPRCSGDSMAD